MTPEREAELKSIGVRIGQHLGAQVKFLELHETERRCLEQFDPKSKTDPNFLSVAGDDAIERCRYEPDVGDIDFVEEEEDVVLAAGFVAFTARIGDRIQDLPISEREMILRDQHIVADRNGSEMGNRWANRANLDGLKRLDSHRDQLQKMISESPTGEAFAICLFGTVDVRKVLPGFDVADWDGEAFLQGFLKGANEVWDKLRPRFQTAAAC